MSRALLSLAGFQVIISGRFWVIAEAGAMPRSNELKKLIPDFVAGLMRTAVVLWQKEEQSIQFEEFHKRFSILVAA
jgi:hypothetical protein